MQEKKGTLPGTNHTVLSDVCLSNHVHVCLVCLDLGFFWITALRGRLCAGGESQIDETEELRDEAGAE